MRAYKSTIEQRSGETTPNRTSNVRLRIWFLLLGVLGLAGCLGNDSNGAPAGSNVSFSNSAMAGSSTNRLWDKISRLLLRHSRLVARLKFDSM